MLKPRVSVIITSYNQEAYLKEAIESILHQTERPYEIIIADDHSTKDNSVKMIKRYEIQHPGWIRPLFQAQNLGIPKNRNRALQMVTGDYVAILDGDDRLLPNSIEMQLAALARHPEVGCSYSNRYHINARGERCGIRDSRLVPSGDILFQVACGRVGILRSMISRYDLIQTAGFLDERFPLHDGFVLTLRLARLTRFIYLPEPLMEKREHKGGVSKALSYKQRTDYFENVFSEVLKETSHLPQWQKRRIKKVWGRWLLDSRVMADLENGRKSRALLRIAHGFARDLGNMRNLRNLTKNVFNAS